jgi:hypothetical protein
MWWECSECGGHIERVRAPSLCGECGTAGVIFVPAEVDDPLVGDLDANCLRAVWLNAGFDQARLTLTAGRG